MSPPDRCVVERPPSRKALVATIMGLIAASAALGGSAALQWAQMDVQAPLRGIVPVRIMGSAVLPALGPLAVLALAAVAAVLASAGWVRWLLGALLLGAAAPPAVAALRAFDGRWLTSAAMSSAQRPVRSAPVGSATVHFAGPALASVAAVLLAAAGVTLVLRGHRMPRLGRRYQTPKVRSSGQASPDERFWERMDAGEDPTAPGHPR
ncbi:MAG TPA: Trp biosynthesis-associated membrane protein [Pseudonocardiaceae bacterium]|nr:Trp biosynthesis-associated membrane protein [Pseudonocardiaceae bacterium]